jgi:hypothetical protein
VGEPRSQKQQQRERLVRSLRAEGKSRVEVAEALRQRYRFNARVALRYAHEWSQRQAADEWNQRWPDELKTLQVLFVLGAVAESYRTFPHFRQPR